MKTLLITTLLFGSIGMAYAVDDYWFDDWSQYEHNHQHGEHGEHGEHGCH